MKLTFISCSLAFLVSSTAVMAGPKCTTEPKAKWQDQVAFQKSLTDKGFKIKEFKVTDGTCYEIYGCNKEGKKVEIYFNPVTAAVVKEEIDS